MPDILTSGGQTLIKNSYASAPSLNLTLICNGEEPTSIFDSLGNLLVAGIDPPTVAPSVVDAGSGGSLVAGYVAYRYVYAATRRYPFVENVTAAGGSVAPRSNPSDSSAPFLCVVNHKNTITLTKTTRSDIDKIWIYRTETFATAQLAATASEAGQLFYLGAVNNDGNSGTITYTDNTDIVAGEQLEFDNFFAPTAAFCVYYEPYFYAFGNFPLEVQVEISYNTVGPITTITLDDADILKWFKGREGQSIKFSEVTTGGYDGFGTYYFHWLTDTTAQLTVDTEGTNGYISLLGTTTATIFGFSTVLYRSKANNPFGWGKTVTVGTLAIPELFVLKVGGGIGTGIVVLPSNAILKLDTENPAKCYSLNLKLQDDDSFVSSLRILSDTYSTSINSTQFPTLNRNKNAAIWSLDTKNYSILECDGSQQIPVSDAVFKFLRTIDASEEAQRNYHGVFDPYTECNFIWVRELDAQPIITHALYQHVPTGQWGMLLDFDITASSSLQDATTNEVLILGGTDTGIFGRILKPFKFINWLADPTEFITGGYEVNTVGTSPNLVIISRENAIEQAEHLTYFKFYFFDVSLAEKSIFVFYDVDSTGDPAPVESVGFDFIIRISVALAASVSTALSAIRAAMISAISSLVSTFSFPTTFVALGGTYNNGATISAANSLTAYNTEVVNYSDGYRFTLNIANYSGHGILGIDALIGVWTLLETGNTGRSALWIRILSSSGTFYIYDETYGDTTLLDGNIASVSTQHLTVWFGLIQCKFQKSFDLNAITKRKTLKEIWLAAQEALLLIVGTSSHEFYAKKFLAGFNDQEDQEPQVLLIPKQDVDAAGSLRDMFLITPKSIPPNPFKSFGITVIQRGYTDHKIYNMALKMGT